MKLLSTLIGVLLVASQIHAQPKVDAPNGWRADLGQLTGELLARHPNPFANIDRATWDSAASDLGGRLDTMKRNQFGVELQRLVALLADAHTSVNPQFDPALSTRRYPVELYLFEDGLYVRSAAPEFSALVGGKVVRIGNLDPGRAVAAVAATISNENTWWIRAWAPERLVIPEVLDGLGIADDVENLQIEVEKGGARTTSTISPRTVSGFVGRGHGATLDKSDWVTMQESADTPLWRRHPKELMWHEWLEDSASLYVCYRSVTSPDEGPSNSEFWDEVFAEADRRNPRRLIIDLRENSGGNGLLNRKVIQQIVRRPDLDRDNKLFVIIGRRTFSAGQQLVNQLDWWTQATFVGEPTGQKVSQYGDADRVTLKNSGVLVFISTRFHQSPNPLDGRSFVPPDIYAPLTSQDERGGIDPALKAVFDSEQREPVMSTMMGALQAGQVDRAERILVNAASAPANRYHDFESEVNAVGYDLLGQGRIHSAVQVFQLNSRAYPGSPNVFDSLGEALLRAGQREEAIKAYRRALEIDPTFPSSLEAIRHLESESKR